MSFLDRELGELVTTLGNAPSQGYLQLKAGKAFIGGYNDGLLRDEVVAGSWPNLSATAKINGGVLDGIIIELLDTVSPSTFAHFVKVA